MFNELKKILTEKELEIFYCYFVDGDKIKDISKKTGISEQLVNYYKNKSIKALQEIVKKFKGNIDKEVIKEVLERIDEEFKK